MIPAIGAAQIAKARVYYPLAFSLLSNNEPSAGRRLREALCQIRQFLLQRGGVDPAGGHG
jgi:hypothetical protein